MHFDIKKTGIHYFVSEKLKVVTICICSDDEISEIKSKFDISHDFAEIDTVSVSALDLAGFDFNIMNLALNDVIDN